MTDNNQNIKHHRYRKVAVLLALYAGFFIFLFSTDPKKLAVGWLILPFLWLYTCLFLTFIYVFQWLSKQPKASRRQTLLSAVLAGIPSAMLLLDSVDQLSFKDFLLILALGILGLFYVRKISLKRNIS